MGRPKANIDWKKVDKYLQAQCDGVGIAGLLGIHPNTLYRLCEEKYKISFSEYSAQKKAEGVVLIEESIYKDALTKGGTDRMQKLQPDITIERNGQPYRKNIKETAAA